MHLDITQARTYFLKKSNWKKLWFIFALIGLLGLIPYVGTLILSLIFTSYAFLLTNLRAFKPDTLPPDFDINPLLPIMGKFLVFNIILSCIVVPPIILYMGMLMGGKVSVPLAIAVIVIPLILLVYAHVASLVFATNLKFASFFKWKAIKYVLVDNFKEYVEFGIVLFFLSLVCFVIMAVSVITIVGPLLLAPLFMLVFADLNAQFVRQVFKINAK